MRKNSERRVKVSEVDRTRDVLFQVCAVGRMPRVVWKVYRGGDGEKFRETRPTRVEGGEGVYVTLFGETK